LANLYGYKKGSKEVLLAKEERLRVCGADMGDGKIEMGRTAACRRERQLWVVGGGIRHVRGSNGSGCLIGNRICTLL